MQSLRSLCRKKLIRLLEDKQYQYINLNLITYDVLSELCVNPKYHLFAGNKNIFIESDIPYDELALYWSKHPRYTAFFACEVYGCRNCKSYPEYCRCERKYPTFENATKREIIENMKFVLSRINYISIYKYSLPKNGCKNNGENHQQTDETSSEINICHVIRHEFFSLIS